MKKLKQKWYLVAALFIVTTLLVFTLGTQEKTLAKDNVTGKGLKILFSCDDLATGFAAELTKAIKKRCQEIGAEVIVTDSRMDAAVQASQVENQIIKGIDAIILKPYDESAAGPISQAAIDAGLPLVTAAQPIKTPFDVCVTSDLHAAGAIAAQAVIDKLGKDISVCMIQGPLAMGVFTMMYDGAVAVLNKNGVKILSSQTGEAKTDVAMGVTESWFSSGLRPDAIIACNDGMAVGAAQAVNEAGLKGKTLVVSIGEGTPEGLNGVKKGNMYATVHAPPSLIGSMSVDAVIDVLNGKYKGRKSEIFLIDETLVTSANVDDFME